MFQLGGSPSSQSVGVTSPYQNEPTSPSLGYQAPLNPSYSPGSPGGTTTGGGSGVSAQTAANNSYWNSIIDQVNNALGLVPRQGQIGHQNILDSYNAAFNTLTNQQHQTERDNQVQKDTTMNDNQIAKNNIASGVRNGLTAIQRLLGANGAGSSSASTILAPYAAGYEGNQQRQQVQTNYGRNMGAIDTALSDAENQFQNSFGSLGADRTNRDRALDSQLAQTQQGLYQQKAMAQRYMNQAPDPSITGTLADLGRQVTELGAQQTFTPPTVTYKPADLNQYNYDANQAPVDSNQGALASNTGPFFNLLNPDKKKDVASGNLAGATA